MGDIYGVVIQVIAPFIAGEITLLGGVKDDIDAIQKELRSISVFLKNAEEKAEGIDEAKEWVRQVRMLAYDFEDAIERYHLFLKENAYSRAKQYLSFEYRSMASAIKTLRETSANIAKSKEAYRFDDHHGHGSSRGKPQEQFTTLYFQCTVDVGVNADIVGDDEAKGDIIDLLKLRMVNSRPSIIAVVGMRGLGKTTVVASVYHDRTVRAYFPVRAWIPMSQPKKHIEILKSMVLQFMEPTNGRYIAELNSMDKRSLQQILKSFLKDKRYMVVFDDVEERDTELITFIKRVLPFNEEGSKILMTTRYENVGHTWLDGSIHGMYKLKPLPPGKATELFFKKTFKSFNGNCPPHLKDLADGIVRKCGGLPPAIISVSRLLSSKENDMNEWEKVRNSLGFYLAENRQLSGINHTILQNYYDLPYYLKPCFLYFGLFPKGQPINRTRLIRLWIAEGFIGETRGNNLTLEEIAEEYVSEMINMSMIEAKSRDVSGKVRSLGMVSEFLREMIQTKLDELSFCKILSKKDCAGDETSRRLSIHQNHNSNAPDFLDYIKQRKSSIRSLFVLEVGSEIMLKLCDRAFFKSINLLKVLDLFNAPIDDVPREIGTLLNLRYLSLRCTRVSTIPSSIGKLENLLTLDLKQTFVSQLPKEINKLRKLRHLLGYYYEYNFGFSGHCLRINGVSMPEGLSLGKCLELQQLEFLDVGLGDRNWAMELRNLRQLRKLGILGLKVNEGEDLCEIIDGMKHLQTLSIFSSTKIESINLANVKSPPTKLKRLYLNGPIDTFPTWVYGLYNLVKIQLRWSSLLDDPLETLQSLPNLAELQLLEAFVGEELNISSNGFQKLKKLSVLDMHSLKSLNIAKGGLPLVQEMSIGESKHLQMPSGIKYLTNLKTLNFYNMPSHFSNRIRPGELYYSIVRHVPKLFCHIKHPKGYWQTYSLR